MLEKPSSVRIATRADEQALYWFLMNDLGADNGLGFNPSAKKVLSHVQKCCRGDMGIAGVVDGLHGIEASTAIEMIEPWYSTDLMLMQVWLFVTPSARQGQRHSDALFDFCEWHRQDMSVRVDQPLILETAVMSHKRLKSKLRLWSRKANQIGGIFWSGHE